MMIKKVAATTAVLAAAGGLALAVAAPASARVRPFSDTVHLTGNYDSGNHGPWAALDYQRTVKISPIGHNTWSLTLTDKGAFTTIRGAKAPEAGATIGHAVKGTFKGSYRFTVTSSHRPSARGVHSRYNFRCDLHGTGNRANDCPGMPSSTGDWPKLYFGADAQVKPGKWTWDYRTKCERWVNSSDGDRGDITGKVCRPSHGHGGSGHGSQGHGGHGQPSGHHGHAPKLVSPGRPVARAASCATGKGAVITPYVPGVSYRVVDSHHRQLTAALGGYPAAPGTYTVTASAQNGYQLKPRSQHVWTVTVAAPRWCPSSTHTPIPYH